MKKKVSTPNKKDPRKKLKPILKWQTGDYERHADFHFVLPYQFLLLCKLMDVTPDQVLTDFMDNLSCSSWKRESREKAKEHLVDYFVAHAYGQHHYSVEDIKTMFKELDAIGLLWPANAKMKLIDLHSKWREKYHSFWFKKWYKKPRKRSA